MTLVLTIRNYLTMTKVIVKMELIMFPQKARDNAFARDANFSGPLRDFTSWKSRVLALRVLLPFSLLPFHGFSSFSRGRQRNVRFSRLLLVAPLTLSLSFAPLYSPRLLSISLYPPPPWARSSIANSMCKGAFILCERRRTQIEIRRNINNDRKREKPCVYLEVPQIFINTTVHVGFSNESSTNRMISSSKI